jgi:hypothetical protein
MATIEELLKSMLTLASDKKSNDFTGLENSRSTWERIGSGDSFAELGFESNDAKEAWLKEWISENPYQAIN